MKLVTVLTVQQAKQAFYTARMAQRALRSDTAADRCVNLAVHTSGKQSRIHTCFLLSVFWRQKRCRLLKDIISFNLEKRPVAGVTCVDLDRRPKSTHYINLEAIEK